MTSKGKKAIIAVLIIVVLAVIFMATRPDSDTIKFEGKKYSVLGYPANVFYYDLNTGGDFEEDGIYPIESGQYDLVYHNGDVYCSKKDFRDAIAYYDDYDNYEWFVIIEEDEEIYPLIISEDDSQYIYSIDEIEKETAIFFEEIETMGSLLVVSKDGVISGRTSLAEYGGDWYWRSEIIDESRESDGTWPEYIIKLPEEVNQSIIKLSVN